MTNIRNFVIISHIDHGKSTLADRFLELTGTVEKRKMHDQYLDRMPLEQEKGITIKMQPVRMEYKLGGEKYILNLIDTPGHVDFSYEVSRALAAVEGAILLVDATQGVQAQTLANFNLAKLENIKIIPAVNKIDMSNADIRGAKQELAEMCKISVDEILEISAKIGAGVKELLESVILSVPAPKEKSKDISRALIFDSAYDAYKGVVAFVRIVDGSFSEKAELKIMASGAYCESLEIGVFRPDLESKDKLNAGEIGYIATGLKDATLVRVGDTVITAKDESKRFLRALEGYKEPKSMVYVSFFPEDSDDYETLGDAVKKLRLSDAAFHFEAVSSEALGRGFRCGFLGMLHMEIISERLKREFNLSIIASQPTVPYKIIKKNGENILIHSPHEMPVDNEIEEIQEPWSMLEIITPQQYLGQIIRILESKRGVYKNTNYLSAEKVVLMYELPLHEIIIDLYDKIKSVSSGYASMNYELLDFIKGDLIKMDILVAGNIVEAFSRIVHEDKAYEEGKRLVKKLKEVLPRQNFAVSLQAAVGSKIIARENISALRKDVTGYLYGGDVTRKKKLLQKQKKGKKKMKALGRVNIPTKVFLDVLKY